MLRTKHPHISGVWVKHVAAFFFGWQTDAVQAPRPRHCTWQQLSIIDLVEIFHSNQFYLQLSKVVESVSAANHNENQVTRVNNAQGYIGNKGGT
jgi:hypothetical protein